MFPPHLPPPSCDLKQHRMRERVLTLFGIAVFSVFAGIVGASITLGWIWPGLGAGDTWVNSAYYRATPSKGQIDDGVARTLDHSLVTLYSGVTEVGKTRTLSPNDSLGVAPVIGSEGWVVLYQANYKTADFKNWRALTSNGTVFTVAKVLPDVISGLVYVQLGTAETVTGTTSGSEQFSRPVTFALVEKFDDVYVWQRNAWQRNFVVNTVVRSNHQAHLDSAPIMRYELNQPVSPGAVVVSTDGRLVGVGTDSGLVLPATAIEQVWASVSAEGRARYATLGAVGWFSVEQPIIVAGVSRDGFVVTKVVSSGSVLKRGDIVTTVNGQPATFENMLRVVNGANVNASVWRNNKMIQLTVPTSRVPAAVY